jgi:hypothetical protein
MLLLEWTGVFEWISGSDTHGNIVVAAMVRWRHDLLLLLVIATEAASSAYSLSFLEFLLHLGNP